MNSTRGEKVIHNALVVVVRYAVKCNTSGLGIGDKGLLEVRYRAADVPGSM
jgi:hypothetical protein